MASTDNLNQLEPTFMYTQIFKDILLDMKHDKQAIQDFITYSRQNDCGSTKIINEFEKKYDAQSAIYWYSYPSFLYSMLNNALRFMEGDTIINMGFFIHDLHQQIQKLHRQQVNSYHGKPFIVYRGQGLYKANFQKLQKTEGGIMSFNNFLSTSTEQDIALGLAYSASENEDMVGILFIMSIDPCIKSAPFASIKEKSYFKNEEEILFSMHTVFRVSAIKQMGNNNQLYQVELQLTSDDDHQLRLLTDQMREESDGNSEWERLGRLLLKIGQCNKAQELFDVLLEQTSDESKKAFYYNQLGYVKEDQGNYAKAIWYYQNALAIREKTVPSNHPDLATSYSNIGWAYNKMADYPKALSFTEKALEIDQKTLPSNHPDLTTSYNNIAGIYDNMGEYSKALSFSEKALEIDQKTLLSNHPSLATSYNNIGWVYESKKDYSRALSYYEKALKIREKTLPPNHPSLATSYNNIAGVYENIEEHQKALSYYEKALKIREKTLPSDHPSLATSYNDIAGVYDSMGEYSKALLFSEKALEIDQKTLPSNHPNLATSYNNIGWLYKNMKDYLKALSYYEKALKIREKTLPPNHLSLATSYSNISLVYKSMGEYSKALLFSEKALEIREKTLPSDHPDLATSYNNMGWVYDNIGEHPKALSFHEKALEIREKTLPSDHPSLATSYSNIGLVYENMGEYSKALSFHEKALEIRQRTVSSNHPDLATSYNNIGSVYKSIGEYQKALSFHEKALKIQEGTLCPNHPSLATSYSNISLVYKSIGEYSKALSFSEKALEIDQRTLPSQHPDLATSYNSIGLVYENMRDYSKALSYFERALGILQILPMLRNFGRIATNVCRQHRIAFEVVRTLASTPLNMPSLSPTMSEGTIIRWLKKEGEEVNPGDALCEIQTDKATMTLDTEDEGILAKILMPDNSTDVKVGKLIALLVEKGDDWKNVEVPKTEEKSSSSKSTETKKVETKDKQEKQEKPKSDKQQAEQSHHAIGPAARTLLDQYGIESSKIKGTGPHGVVMKSDVQKYIDSNQLKVKSHSEEKKSTTKQTTSDTQKKQQISESGGRRYHDIEISSIRRAIAKRLTYSKTNIPHQYISITSNVDQILKLRKQMVSDPKATVKVSVNDFIIKAVASALRQVPQMNGIYDDKQGLKLQSSVDVSVAVATDNGLITPIVFNADRLSVQDVNGQVRQLATKAKDGKLKPNEFQGGSFTISNLGMFGIRSFSAVINPPQIGILAIGQNLLKHTGDDLKAENQLTVTLSYDARACDPQSSALFLQAFRSYMENPNMLLSNNKSESILNF
ncbi:unnamed protein product [Adineta steineri]|uniref:NAD(P)(+)--arginine ADP-ribosyltransferase n=1 Tax=Adineta steineri TaxID=433720 RepID=A0A815P9C1_9BILA|nr:unnamed protein product [Adineta steineri]CAF1629135.1 unnamed protein product [Adineta steineri]